MQTCATQPCQAHHHVPAVVEASGWRATLLSSMAQVSWERERRARVLMLSDLVKTRVTALLPVWVVRGRTGEESREQRVSAALPTLRHVIYVKKPQTESDRERHLSVHLFNTACSHRFSVCLILCENIVGWVESQCIVQSSITGVFWIIISFCLSEVVSSLIDLASWNHIHNRMLWRINQNGVHLNSVPPPNEQGQRFVFRRAREAYSFTKIEQNNKLHKNWSLCLPKNSTIKKSM